MPRASLDGSNCHSGSLEVSASPQVLPGPGLPRTLLICAEMGCNLPGSFPCCDAGRALDVTEKWLPQALQGETQLIQVAQNPVVAGAGRSLRAHPFAHLPPAQVAQKSRCPSVSCRPGGSDGAGDLIYPRMDSVEVTCSEVTRLWEQLLWLPAALCGGWGRLAQVLAVPRFQGAAVTSRKVQV